MSILPLLSVSVTAPRGRAASRSWPMAPAARL